MGCNPCLLDWKAGDSLIPYLVCIPPEKDWEKVVLKSLLDWTKGLPDVWGDVLDKIPLLLEGVFQTRIGCLLVLAHHPVYHPHKVSSPLDFLHDPCFL